MSQEEQDPVVQAAEEAVREAERILGTGDLMVAERLEDLAVLYRERKDFLAAANVQARAKLIRQRYGQVDDNPAAVTVAKTPPDPAAPGQFAILLDTLTQILILDARQWCRGRSWQARAPLILFFAYVFVRHLQDPMYTSIFKGLNLGIHELGHMVFMPLSVAFPGRFSEFLVVAGGSFIQCLVPIIAMFMFFLQSDFFAVAVAFGWLSTNLFDVAVYAGDARAMELPLVSPFGGGGGGEGHDWHYLLSATRLLQYDQSVSGAIRLMAVVSMLICLTYGAWLVNNMRTLKKPISPH